MQANLIFNDSAGLTLTKPTKEALMEALQLQGFSPVYHATEKEEDLDELLRDVEGMVVAAGGDGTLRAVITRLIGRADAPIVLLPMGTANNVASALNINDDPLTIINKLSKKRPYAFDVGKVTAPWGVDHFLEGAGFGFFADILATYDPAKGKSVLRSVKAFTDIFTSGQSYQTSLICDGEEVEGNFLLVEALNTTAVGPRLKFAPDATPGDGLLNIVCIHESDRTGFMDYLRSLIAEDLHNLETVTVCKAREVRLEWDGFAVHIDAELRPPGVQEEENGNFALSGTRQFDSGALKIEVLPGAVELWLPPEGEDENE